MRKDKKQGNCLICKHKDNASGSEYGYCWDCSKENSKWERAKCLPVPVKKVKKDYRWTIEMLEEEMLFGLNKNDKQCVRELKSAIKLLKEAK